MPCTITYGLVMEQIRQNPDHLEALICYLVVSRYLERIADQATNIAEDVLYMIEGKIFRHTGRRGTWRRARWN
jgi:phosphate transport system protein